MPQKRMPRTPATTRVSPEKWAAVRTALRDTGERFADMIVSVPDPSILATKDWSVAETAAHVTGIAWNNTALVAEDGRAMPIPEVRAYVPVTTGENIHTGLNTAQLHSYAERNPVQLADRLRDSIAEIRSITEQADPERTIAWLGASRLPLAGVLAHMTNELLVHGWDIARAVGMPWQIAEQHAALFFDLFLVEIIRNGYGRMLDYHLPARPGCIAVEFRSAHTTPVTIALDADRVTVAEPNGDSDIHIRFRPAALDLLLWHRMSYLRAAFSGSVVVWGRRPWLLPAFLRKVRLP